MAGHAAAQDDPAPAPAPRPGCDGAEWREFDFWVGQWDVQLGDGTPAGSNSIESTENGCLIVEHWRSVGGGTGTSINFRDPSSGKWRQQWVSPGAQIDITGGIDDGSMVLDGYIVYVQGAVRRPFRGKWTPLEDGRVRQFFEEFDDGAWKPWFEGFYGRRASTNG